MRRNDLWTVENSPCCKQITLNKRNQVLYSMYDGTIKYTAANAFLMKDRVPIIDLIESFEMMKRKGVFSENCMGLAINGPNGGFLPVLYLTHGYKSPDGRGLSLDLF